MTCIDLFQNRTVDPSTCPATVLALGNFDGVHIGHIALLREAVRSAEILTTESDQVFPGVWLFRDPPSDTLKDPPIPHLSSTEDKLRCFREYGIRYVFLGNFQELSGYTPRDFAVNILQKECHCRHAVCGFNYSFGFRGTGTSKMLSEYFDGAITEIPPVEAGGSPVSSTRIRALLSDGKVREAAALLGRPYSITLPVQHGKALGRTIDFPTANQNFPPLTVIPSSGIYAVEVLFPWEKMPIVRYGIANIGLRPTVESSDRINCETYIFDFSGDLYGKDVEIRFIERLREERKMSGVDELKATIRNDEAVARKLFGLPTRTE